MNRTGIGPLLLQGWVRGASPVFFSFLRWLCLQGLSRRSTASRVTLEGQEYLLTTGVEWTEPVTSLEVLSVRPLAGPHVEGPYLHAS